MKSDFVGAILDSVSTDRIYFLGECLYYLAYAMTVAGFVSFIIRDIAHQNIDTFFPFPTFWIPESLGGCVITFLLFVIGFGLCFFVKDLDRGQRHF